MQLESRVVDMVTGRVNMAKPPILHELFRFCQQKCYVRNCNCLMSYLKNMSLLISDLEKRAWGVLVSDSITDLEKLYCIVLY